MVIAIVGMAHATVPVCLMKRSLSDDAPQATFIAEPTRLGYGRNRNFAECKPERYAGLDLIQKSYPVDAEPVSNAAAVSPPVAAKALASRAAGASRLASAEASCGLPALCEQEVEAMSTTTSRTDLSEFRIAPESSA